VNLLVPLPVILPLFAAGLSLMLHRRQALQRVLSTTTLSAVVALAAVLVVQADRHGPQVSWIGAWPEPLGISLVADRVSALMLLVSSVVSLAVMVYSIGQGMTSDDDETPLSIYHPTFLVLVAGVANAFLAGDLFNLFVSFEVLLFASYVLLTLGGTMSRIRAGTIYVVVNMVASMLFLASVAAVYAATGSLNFAQLAQRLANLPDGVALVLQLMLLVTFAIKAAVFPLSLWLPDSYPTAPAPVTAVFAGLLTKVGVYAILRLQSLLFPDSPLTGPLMVAALLTMVVGILGAIAQSDLKRLLSFTLVSHIGYMLFGIALATVAGFSGAIFYVVHHITIQTSLFLVLGLVERRAGSSSLLRLGGVARLAPMFGVLFFVPAMNLAGIPPLSGFLGKVGLIRAGLEVGTPLAYVLVAGGVTTSLLTLYAVGKAWNLAFWRTPEQAHEMVLALPNVNLPVEPGRRTGLVRRGRNGDAATYPGGPGDDDEQPPDGEDSGRDLHELLQAGELPDRLPRSMTAATAGLIAFSLGITVVAGPLYAYTDRAAEDITGRTAYVETVLPGGAP
jgi:multicomponent Na+:H+ antiporter subunit D